jgi:hypothetical protein
MRVERRDSEYMMVAWVYPFDDDKNASCITVKRERDWDDKERWEGEAEISWQFVGKNDAETMRVFAASMLEACRIADEMNEQPAARATE